MKKAIIIMMSLLTCMAMLCSCQLIGGSTSESSGGAESGQSSVEETLPGLVVDEDSDALGNDKFED